jgi:gamma-glutamyl:cysteine ligase YbdK (ATP-grasp superfamily)
MPDPSDEQIRKQRTQFIKSFEDLATATANLHAISKKQIELMNKQIEITHGLIETMMQPRDGMRDVIDELIDEMRGLRDDLRVIAKAGGLGTVLTLLNQVPRRR